MHRYDTFQAVGEEFNQHLNSIYHQLCTPQSTHTFSFPLLLLGNIYFIYNLPHPTTKQLSSTILQSVGFIRCC